MSCFNGGIVAWKFFLILWIMTQMFYGRALGQAHVNMNFNCDVDACNTTCRMSFNFQGICTTDMAQPAPFCCCLNETNLMDASDDPTVDVVCTNGSMDDIGPFSNLPDSVNTFTPSIF